MATPVTPPAPELEPRPITIDDYYAFAPEKFELIQGFLFAPPDWHEGREGLLRLLLLNEGLLAAVRLAPRERWLEAIRRVYAEPPSAEP